MSAPTRRSTSPEIVALFEKAVATRPGVERMGAANPYTSLNGNMFSLLSPPGVLALRLSEAEREKFLKKFKTTLYEAHGSVMKEYVTVPESLLENTRELAKYYALSYAYAKSLKPEVTKRR